MNGDGNNVLSTRWATISQLSVPFDFKRQCSQYHMSPKKSKAVVPYEVTIREDRKKVQSLLKVAIDATVLALSAFPISMIDNILPFLPPHDLFNFINTVKICQKSLMHELVV